MRQIIVTLLSEFHNSSYNDL